MAILLSDLLWAGDKKTGQTVSSSQISSKFRWVCWEVFDWKDFVKEKRRQTEHNKGLDPKISSTLTLQYPVLFGIQVEAEPKVRRQEQP